MIKAPLVKKAEHIALTKSICSKQRITALEKASGVQLIYRTTSKLTLTEADGVFYPHAKEDYNTVQNAEDTMCGLGESLTVKIPITAPII